MEARTGRFGRRGWRTVAAGVALAGVASAGIVPSADAAEGTRYLDEVFTSYTTTSDIPYGESTDYKGEVQTHLLDVLQPVGDTANARAAVVWVHGGYFKRGSKDIEWYQEAREQFVKAGYVVFSINYRLNDSLPEGLLPTIQTLRLEEYIQEAKDSTHDAQAAVRWVRAHAPDYRVNPDLIAVAGHSAGGIIAQAVAWNSEDPGNSGTPGVSSRVAAAVSSAGGTLPGVLSYVGLNEPPVLISHGVSDDVVPYPAAVPACVLTVLLGNVCEQQLKLDQKHPQFGYDGWREFLYRRMIKPKQLDLPFQLRLVP
ncbi:MAG: alpha/beta hydrolase [Actinomycetota bacterium]|nr:alpha/beta hydrolase [Actinomycetota bacterium]